jgi:MIP family channel proteins
MPVQAPAGALTGARGPGKMLRMNTSPTLRAACLAELIGTALLILLGDGVVGSVVLLGKQADWIVITTGWALAVTLGVLVSARISGGHLNPAVTIALATRGAFPWAKVPPYVLAQVAGAFLGAVLVYVNYGAAFEQFESKHQLVRGAMANGMLPDPAAGGAGVFCTFPAFGQAWRNVFTEFLGTAVLLGCVRAIADRRNWPATGGLEPFLVGAIVWAIGLSLGGLTGYAINPARDFGPRLAAACLGWGASVFQSHDGYYWVPIVGPILGGVAGVWIYDLLLAPHQRGEA